MSTYSQPTNDCGDTPPLRILLVEDNVDAANSLAELLRLYGYTVETAYDGPAGVHLGRWWHPDVVLLDIGLPGVNGWQVAAILNAELEKPDAKTEKKPLLVAITGFGTEADRNRSEEVGIHLHVVKPADPEKLLSLLRRFNSVAH